MWVLCELAQLEAQRDTLDADGTAAVLRTVDASIAELRRWAEVSPDNVAHKLSIAQLRRARAVGDVTAAVRACDHAFELLEGKAFQHDRGLLCEQAAELGLTLDCPSRAAELFEQAFRCYQDWGASAAAGALLQRRELAHDRTTDPPRGPARRPGPHEQFEALLTDLELDRAMIWAEPSEPVVIADRWDGHQPAVAVRTADRDVLPQLLMKRVEITRQYIEAYPGHNGTVPLRRRLLRRSAPDQPGRDADRPRRHRGGRGVRRGR